MQKEADVQCFYIRERTLLSKTDNLCTLFWARKGSTTTSAVPVHLLQLMSIHQHFYRDFSRFNYLPGKMNVIGDNSSRLFKLTNTQFLHRFNTIYPQKKFYQLWTPSPDIISTVISALIKQSYSPKSLLHESSKPIPSGSSVQPSPVNWTLTPF